MFFKCRHLGGYRGHRGRRRQLTESILKQIGIDKSKEHMISASRAILYMHSNKERERRISHCPVKIQTTWSLE